MNLKYSFFCRHNLSTAATPPCPEIPAGVCVKSRLRNEAGVTWSQLLPMTVALQTENMCAGKFHWNGLGAISHFFATDGTTTYHSDLGI